MVTLQQGMVLLQRKEYINAHEVPLSYTIPQLHRQSVTPVFCSVLVLSRTSWPSLPTFGCAWPNVACTPAWKRCGLECLRARGDGCHCAMVVGGASKSPCHSPGCCATSQATVAVWSLQVNSCCELWMSTRVPTPILLSSCCFYQGHKTSTPALALTKPFSTWPRLRCCSNV